MFKTFGTEEAVFVNQDEGMFVAFPYTFDEASATLETETIGGRKYVKAGSLVKEGDTVAGNILKTEEFNTLMGGYRNTMSLVAS